MDLLLDTHTFLWLSAGDPKLSVTAKRLIMDGTNRCFLSIASVWEMAVKMNLPEPRRLILAQPLDIFMVEQLKSYEIELLSIDLAHACKISVLAHGHGDPFDRMIIAQSLVTSIPIIGMDAQFDRFGVQRIW